MPRTKRQSLCTVKRISPLPKNRRPTVDLEQQQPDGSHREAGDGLQYMVLDTNRVELRKARRWGTREAIDGLKEAEK